MSEAPSLSIVIPVHNEERVLSATLLSALEAAAAYPAPVEIVVALNGCRDRSAQIARLYPVRVIEDERCGMSYGNNLGGRAAQHDLLIFWDADTLLEPADLQALAETARGRGEVAGGMWTYPDRPSWRATAFFFIMNQFCLRRRIPAAGIVILSRSVYERIGGFDETIPQGTGSDVVRRALAAGAEFIYVHTRGCRTSVRRFEKRGYLRQLLEWRRNIRLHGSGQQKELAKHDYEVIR